MNCKLKFIDLFAGCGGLSLGLMNAGLEGIFAIEKTEDAFKTLIHNLDHKKIKNGYNILKKKEYLQFLWTVILEKE